MRVFSFVQTSSIKKTYDGLILKYKKYDSTIEMSKVIFLFVILLLAGFVYLYYINLSSTRGYFLKQENQKLNSISFEFEILKTKMLEYRQKDRESIQGVNSRRNVIDIKAEVVQIPGNTDLAINDPSPSREIIKN